MKKSDKKIENSIRHALTEVCDIALEEVAGFQWVTHWLDYGNVSKSLRIVCVFDTEYQLDQALADEKHEYIRSIVVLKLGAAGVRVDDINKQLTFDTEEACHYQHNGKWDERFRRH